MCHVRSAVAVQPCSSTATGPPGRPVNSRTKVVPRPGSSTKRPGGRGGSSGGKETFAESGGAGSRPGPTKTSARRARARASAHRSPRRSGTGFIRGLGRADLHDLDTERPVRCLVAHDVAGAVAHQRLAERRSGRDDVELIVLFLDVAQEVRL